MTIDPKNLSATATLSFADEFNSLSLWNGTSGTWSTKYPFAPEKGGSLPSNGEQEWYINSTYAPTDAVNPWSVSNGVLTLTAQPASASTQSLIDGYKYTSGMINTYNSFSQQYGYFEMRADLPAGKGLWPAFWLLQEDMSWPPEIDAMEVLGHDMTTLYTASHTNQTGTHTSTGGTIKVPDMSAGYHTYGVDWQKDYITYYFDGNQVWKTPTPADMNEPMYMIANLAVGGGWPGNPDSTTPFPAEMNIDYIRAYTDKGVAPPTGGGSTGGGSTGGGSTGGGSTGGGSTGGGSRPIRERPDRDHSSDGSNDGGGRGHVRGERPDRPDRPTGADRPDRSHTRDDSNDGRDRADRASAAQRDDSHDDTSTTHGREARSHTTSGDDATVKLVGSAGSDTFDFSNRADRADRADRTDQITSSHHDSAGSTRIDSDTDAGADHQMPVLIGDHVQLTGAHTHHSDMVH